MPFLDSLWTAMDEAITLQDCDVYSYKSDGEDDPFGADSIPRQTLREGNDDHAHQLWLCVSVLGKRGGGRGDLINMFKDDEAIFMGRSPRFDTI